MGHRSNSPTLETTGRLSGSRTARTSTLFSVSLWVGMACSRIPLLRQGRDRKQQQDGSRNAADHVPKYYKVSGGGQARNMPNPMRTLRLHFTVLCGTNSGRIIL